jgi:predicted dehydrogenase
VDSSRVELAIAGGADHGFSAKDRPAERVLEASAIGVDGVLVTAASASADPLLLAAQIARDRGTLVLIGDVPANLPRAPLYEKELSFRISRSYGPGRYDVAYEQRGLDYPIGYVRWTQQRNMQCVLDLQARGLLDLSSLVEDVVPVNEAAAAYARLGSEDSERPRGVLLLGYDEDDEGFPISEVAPNPGPRPSSSDGSPRIGLIGPGGFAANVLVPALVEARARLVVVGGGSGPSAEAARRNLGFGRVVENEFAVIDDPEVEAVVITTRHGSHAELATRALAAGKHVFCEKPLALDQQELAQVLDAARRSQRVLLVGFNRRFSPFLGEVRSFLGGVPLVANYRISAGRIAPSGWVHDLEEGGGRIIGETCHFLDSLVYLAGAQIHAVAAAAAGDAVLPLQARDNVVVNVTLGNDSVGTIAYVAAGSSSVPKERLEAFAGTRTAILDDYKTLELYEDGTRHKQGGRRQDKGHVGEIRAFVEAVRAGVSPVPIEEIENVSLAALAVVESLRTGATVAVRRREERS